jgi:serine/threonine protein kinase
MEYASGGNLRQHLNQLVKFDEHTTKFYAAEIALAVNFLHEKGLMQGKQISFFYIPVI